MSGFSVLLCGGDAVRQWHKGGHCHQLLQPHWPTHVFVMLQAAHEPTEQPFPNQLTVFNVQLLMITRACEVPVPMLTCPLYYAVVEPLVRYWIGSQMYLPCKEFWDNMTECIRVYLAALQHRAHAWPLAEDLIVFILRVVSACQGLCTGLGEARC